MRFRTEDRLPIAAPRRSDTAAVESIGYSAKGTGSRVPDGLNYGHQVFGEFIRCLGLCSASYRSRKT